MACVEHQGHSLPYLSALSSEALSSEALSTNDTPSSEALSTDLPRRAGRDKTSSAWRDPRCQAPTSTLHPTPYTLHPTPYTLHPTPYTPSPTPYTPHPTPYNLQRTLQNISSVAPFQLLAGRDKTSSAVAKLTIRGNQGKYQVFAQSLIGIRV